MGLSPSRHSVNTVSVRISNSVPCGLGRPPWSPTPWSPLAGALAPSCTLQRRCRWLCSAPSCSGTMYERHRLHPAAGGTGGTLLQGAASCVPLGARAQALPFPRHPKGLGRSPHWPRHPLFLEHGLETGVVDNKGFFTVHSAMGRRPPLCYLFHCPLSDGPQAHTVHSVMGRRPTLCFTVHSVKPGEPTLSPS